MPTIGFGGESLILLVEFRSDRVGSDQNDLGSCFCGAFCKLAAPTAQ